MEKNALSISRRRTHRQQSCIQWVFFTCEPLHVTVIIFVLSASLLFGQTTLPDAPSVRVDQQQHRNVAQADHNFSHPDRATSHADQQCETSDATAACTAQDDSRGKQTKRMFWVVPNFSAVSADTQLPPLSPKEKFKLAMQDSFDYSSFAWAGILSLQGLATNSEPELGHGMAGYGRYYWRTLADGISGTFFTEALVPAITHEDPRYYTLGHGSFFRRTGYAMTRVLVTRTDSGTTSFNWSAVVGDGLEAGLHRSWILRSWMQRGVDAYSRGVPGMSSAISKA